jgi:hypothetical protein
MPKARKKKRLALYVWEDVLADYTRVVMFALAYSPKHARNLILKNMSCVPKSDIESEPHKITKPFGLAVFGGG